MEGNHLNFKWCAIILAAGSSSRMGKPKQFLKIGDETLIRKSANEALGASPDQTLIVTGLDHDLIKHEVDGLALEVIVNPHSEKGMGNSLKFGVEFVMKNYPDMGALMILVCDQPLLTSNHLKKMVLMHLEKATPIVASFYSGRSGVPVLFHRSMFESLLLIKDQQGARNLIEQNPALVKSIDFPEGAIDLDTPEDFEKFIKPD